MTEARSLRSRLFWPHGALLAFVVVVRIAPGFTRPTAAPDDCERVSRADSAAMERCLAVRPDDVELMVDLADGYQRHGDHGRAAALYRRALTVDPDDGEVRRRLEALHTDLASGE